MLVKVAIDLALDRLFTYSVPAAMEKKLAVGQLLLVPFGYRSARGFALAVCDDADAPRKDDGTPVAMKSVEGIVDETPFFSPATLELVKTVAAYTASPVETVLKAAVPAAVIKPNARPKERFYVEPAGDTPQNAGTVPQNTPQNVGTVPKNGGTLPKNGGTLPKKSGKKCGDRPLTKKQKWLYEQIVRLGGGWLQQLCRELDASPAMFKALASRGLVKIALAAKRRDPLVGRRILPSQPLALNAEQSAALDLIVRSPARPVLLHGVTGSGKTEVYLQAIAAELAAGRGAIVMVPEISLTPQTVHRFASRFGGLTAVLHSALSDGERYDEWHRIRSGEARVVVGPRSAVFAPVRNLGLIVVDEEHDTSYKQDDTPRYNARDVAVLRGRVEGAKVVLGSATPSLESWMNARRGKYALASMKNRAGAGTMPGTLVVDMSSGPDAGRIFSKELFDAICLRLDRGEQTILFLNRRGWSRSVTCAACAAPVTCPKCSVPYTYHMADSCCRCHVCGGWIPVPQKCPACGSPRLDFKGVGTQRVEGALKQCFPRARILRMDADSTSRKNSHDDILGAFRRHEADILVGTQMITKGLDFPNVTLVGVLNAESSLNMPDFRAAERTFQLISQVAGRAGRSELPGEAIIQCRDPNAIAVRAAAKGDYQAFAETELGEREAGFFPPFCHLAAVNVRSESPQLASGWADLYAKSLVAADGTLDVGEAVPGALEKADGWYRWQVVVRSLKVGAIVRAWKWVVARRPPPKTVRIAIDIDAYNLI